MMVGYTKRGFMRLYCVLSMLCCVCLSGILWADDTVRIMPMGDSVTTGIFTRGVPVDNADRISYRYELYNMLNVAGYDFDFVGSELYGLNFFSDVENASFPGIHSDALSVILDTGWNQHTGVYETDGPYFETHPTDIVLLLIGIAGYPVDLPEYVGLVLDEIDEFSEDAIVILGLIPNVMCCADIPPCSDCAGVSQFNDDVKELALARIVNGDQIVIVDMENGAGLDYHEQPVGDMYDRWHETQSGYDKIAIVWYDALKSVLPEPDPFAPKFTTNAITHVDADAVYKYYSYAVGNPDPCYAMLEGPEGMTFEPYPYGPTMLLQWTPTIADLGPHSVTMAVSNSEGVAQQSFDLYVTLQSVMDAANPGDTIVVPQGIYRENIDFKGKNLVVVSTDPCDPMVVANTVILGDCSVPAITFSGAENSACRLSGFTITGGHAIDSLARGGGICGKGTNATISHCVIEGNQSDFTGGGVDGLSGRISHCSIRNNTSKTSGGGIAGSTCEIFNCIISGNTAEGLGGAGVDSASALHACYGDIINCTITNNVGPGDKALRSCDGSFTNCIIWGNNGDGLSFHTAVMSYCCWPEGNEGTGNIAVDPCFTAGGYCLSQISAGQSDTSPCVDTGSDTSANLELDVLSTSTDGAMDTGTVDMGYHYDGTPTCQDVIDYGLLIMGDFSGPAGIPDCYVNLYDFAAFAGNWLRCNNPQDAGCESSY